MANFTSVHFVPIPPTFLSLKSCIVIQALTIPLPFPFPFTEEKTENAEQYAEYVKETKRLREELGVLLREELYNGGVIA